MSRVRRGRATKLACGHTFHKRCIRKWFSRSLTCPYCRAPCMEQMSTNSTQLSVQLRFLLTAVPLPPGGYFPAHMIALLNDNRVVAALHLSPSLRQLLVEAAFFSLTEAQFVRFLDELGL